MGAPLAHHQPSRYNLLAASPAALSALTGPFDDGDRAYVQTTKTSFVYTSTTTVANGVTILSSAAPAGGAWLFQPENAGYTIHGVVGSSSVDYVSSLALAGLVTIHSDSPGIWDVTFAANSGVNAIAAAQATINAAAFGGATATITGANTVRVRTFTGLAGTGAAADVDFSLTVWQ